MHELQIFENEEFGAVEVLYLEGEPLFNPRDLGKCLDMEEKTVRNHLGKMDSDEVVLLKNSDARLTGYRKLNNAGENFLTECGVYSLILKSRKP